MLTSACSSSRPVDPSACSSYSRPHPHPAPLCAAPECGTPVLHARFCDGCFAEAAAGCARQVETRLIGGGYAPGSYELRAALAGYAPALRLAWYQISSPLGALSHNEALRLRELTDAACLLVALGGVQALAKLPGTRAEAATEAEAPPPRSRCDLAALPGRERRGVRRVFSREARFQIGTAAVLLIILGMLVVIR